MFSSLLVLMDEKKEQEKFFCLIFFFSFGLYFVYLCFSVEKGRKERSQVEGSMKKNENNFLLLISTARVVFISFRYLDRQTRIVHQSQRKNPYQHFGWLSKDGNLGSSLFFSPIDFQFAFSFLRLRLLSFPVFFTFLRLHRDWVSRASRGSNNCSWLKIYLRTH